MTIDLNKYDKKKWKKIMDTTQSNYANMIKRLARKSKISNVTLIYYSIFLIMSSLTCKYFPSNYSANLAEYFNIVLSVIILAYSLVNNNANYNIRIANIEKSLNKIKNLKRNLDDSNLEKYIEEYISITDKTERREDIDFFITIIHLCKEHDINWLTRRKKCNYKESDEEKDKEAQKAVNNYLCEISVMSQVLKIIFEYCWYCILILIPIVVFLVCIFA